MSDTPVTPPASGQQASTTVAPAGAYVGSTTSLPPQVINLCAHLGDLISDAVTMVNQVPIQHCQDCGAVVIGGAQQEEVDG